MNEQIYRQPDFQGLGVEKILEYHMVGQLIASRLAGGRGRWPVLACATRLSNPFSFGMHARGLELNGKVE